MYKILIFFLHIFLFTSLNADESLKFFLKKSIENNLQLNAERKKFESAKQNKNISRSEFLPSITITGAQSSVTSENRVNHYSLVSSTGANKDAWFCLNC